VSGNKLEITTGNWVLRIQHRQALDGRWWWNLRGAPLTGIGVSCRDPWEDWQAFGKYRTRREAVFHMRWYAEHDYK